MTNKSLLAAAGLALAVTACGPQDELSSTETSPADEAASVESLLGRDEGIAQDTVNLTYVRPHGVRPLRLAYEVPARPCPVPVVPLVSQPSRQRPPSCLEPRHTGTGRTPVSVATVFPRTQ